MNTQTNLTISAAAKLYGKSRATLYKAIDSGVLSQSNDGKVNLSELIRVYGEVGHKTVIVQDKRIEDSTTIQRDTLVNTLLRERLDRIESLERQLAVKDQQLIQLQSTIKLLEYKTENNAPKSLLVRLRKLIG
jgi:stress-induced morphogen